jgi:hypothetical protein
MLKPNAPMWITEYEQGKAARIERCPGYDGPLPTIVNGRAIPPAARVSRPVRTSPARTVAAVPKPTQPPKPAQPHRARELLRRLPTGPLRGAEIGVYRGESSAILLNRADLHLVMVDQWVWPAKDSTFRKSGDPIATRNDGRWPTILQEALDRTAFAEARRTILRGDSVAAAAGVPDATLDFAFIDCDHSYAGVIRDMRAWLPKLRPGGLFCGHDYSAPYPWTFGVTKAVDELANLLGVKSTLGGDWTWFIRVPAELPDLSELGTFYTHPDNPPIPGMPCLPSCEWVSEPTIPRAVMCGTDAGQERFLPWWLTALRKHNPDLPAIFADFGVTPAARAWCEQRGMIVVTPKGWQPHNAMYGKPHALLNTLASTTLWLDLDAQVRGDLSPAFDGFEQSGRQMGARGGRVIPRTHNHEVNVQAGVVFARYGVPMTQWWGTLCSHGDRQPIHVRGMNVRDEALLIRLFQADQQWIWRMPNRYNSFPGSACHVPDGEVWHYAGRRKQLIKQDIDAAFAAHGWSTQAVTV